MRLLLDQNLSDRLVPLLQAAFPGTNHVRPLGMAEAGDEVIWRYAREHGYAIVSKDDDFRQRSLTFGVPPKVIWVRIGNAPTTRILLRIIEAKDRIVEFEKDETASFLVLE